MMLQFGFEARNEAFDHRPVLFLSESLTNGGDIAIIANRANDEAGKRFTISFLDKNYEEVESVSKDSWTNVVGLLASYDIGISPDSENAVKSFLTASARIF